MARRTFDEHLVLFARYADLVHALTPAAWQRLRARCATIDGSDIDGIIDRAKLLAASQLWLPQFPDPPIAIRAISAAQRLFVTTIALGFETATTLVPSTIGPPSARRGTTGNPRADCHIDASYRIDQAIDRQGMRVGGVPAAVHAAGQGILHHDWFPPGEFHALYRWVETEIPYALVDPGCDVSSAGAH